MDSPQHGAKRRTIKSLLKKKLEEWIASIDDEWLRKHIDQHVIVTGGSIASLLRGESIKDFDLYFDDFDITKKIAEYYVQEFNERHPDRDPQPCVREFVVDDKHAARCSDVGERRLAIWVQSAGMISESEDKGDYRYFERDGIADSEGATEYIAKAAEALQGGRPTEEDKEQAYRPVFMSQNAITLSNKVQLVIRFIGDPAEIHKNYDFTHVTNYYYHGELYTNVKALESLMSQTLYYQGSKYPVATLFRLRKFIQRGWRIGVGELVKIALQISELDLTNRNVLQEQLIGVDAAYFNELLSLLNSDSEKTKPLDSAYIINLIDMMNDG